MKITRFLAACVVAAAGAVALAQGPQGTVPLESAAKYKTHAENNGAAIGATLLARAQIHKTFSSDLDSCCKVVEVALYPAKDGMIEVSLDDFALRIVGQDVAAKPSTPALIAAKLQRRAEPKDEAGGIGPDVVIQPTGGIGYETGGIDPVTGQPRRGGVVTSAGVGVGIGKPQPDPPKPGATDAIAAPWNSNSAKKDCRRETPRLRSPAISTFLCQKRRT